MTDLNDMFTSIFKQRKVQDMDTTKYH